MKRYRVTAIAQTLPDFKVPDDMETHLSGASGRLTIDGGYPLSFEIESVEKLPESITAEDALREIDEFMTSPHGTSGDIRAVLNKWKASRDE